jgi:hypothetical protein
VLEFARQLVEQATPERRNARELRSEFSINVLWPRLELATPQEEGTHATLPATRENTEMRSPLPAGQETYEAHKRINEKFGE